MEFRDVWSELLEKHGERLVKICVKQIREIASSQLSVPTDRRRKYGLPIREMEKELKYSTWNEVLTSFIIGLDGIFAEISESNCSKLPTLPKDVLKLLIEVSSGDSKQSRGAAVFSNTILELVLSEGGISQSNLIFELGYGIN